MRLAPNRSRASRVLVVSCHPSPASFVGGISRQALESLATTGAEVRFTDLYAEGFEPELSAEECRRHLEPGVDPSIQRHADDLTWCDTLVCIYPTWWSGQPAMLKGWFDRVLACGVAWELPDGSNRLVPRLRNVRRIIAITTHGSAKYINMLEGEAGKRTLTRSVRAMCHPLARTHWIALYDVDRCSVAQRMEFIARVDRRLRHIVG